MKNLDKLLKKNVHNVNNKINIPIQKNGAHFICNSEEFNGEILSYLIDFVNNYKRTYKSNQVPIYFEFLSEELVIKDKLVYVMFECICYQLCLDGIKVHIRIQPKKIFITNGIFTSPLRFLIDNKNRNVKSFLNVFNGDISDKHYRKVMKVQELKSNYLGRSIEDMAYSLRLLSLSDDTIDKISEVVEELVGNAGEHIISDCLVDIDVAPDLTLTDDKELSNSTYWGINIAIVSFSDILFGEGIKKKLCNNSFVDNRYLELINAYINHSTLSKGEKNYEEYFWNIAALQDKISGRNNLDLTGGTGLTVLINRLQQAAYGEYCYMMSGNKIIYFNKDYIKYDKNNWFPFNEQNDFLNYLASDDILWKSHVFLPGTAYNLNFVMKASEQNGN